MSYGRLNTCESLLLLMFKGENLHYFSLNGVHLKIRRIFHIQNKAFLCQKGYSGLTENIFMHR